VGEERDLRRQYRDGLRVEQSESQVRSHSYPTSRVRSYGPKNCINVNKGFTQSDTVCQFTRAYSQTSEASIRLSKPRSPIWFRAIPGAPIRPQTEIFQLLFKTYVIPCLEYACLVWNPFYQCHVNSIEAVQRKFLIYLYFKVFGVFPLVGNHNHILREQFKFLSLANRRKIIILLFLDKLIHYRIDCADLLQRLCFCIPRVNNRNVLPLYAAMPRSLLRAPIQSMSSLYNAVCKDFDIYYVSGCYFRKSLTIYFVNKS
jgi:hypothetical protein